MGHWFEPTPLWKFQLSFTLSLKHVGLVSYGNKANALQSLTHGMGMEILWNHTTQYYNKADCF